MVAKEWRNLGSMGLVDKLLEITTPIKKWHKEVFGNIDHRINTLEHEATVVEANMGENGLDVVTKARLNMLRSQLNIWYDCKKCYWKQMSRDHALKDIDGNTKYFQMMASIKRRRKLMVEIKKGRRMLRDPRSII